MRPPVDQVPQTRRDLRDEAFRSPGCRQRLLTDKARVETGETNGCRCRPKIDSDDSRSAFVEMKKLGPAPAGGATARTLGDPSLLDELFGDRRDGASLQARMARQVGARDRLVAAGEIEKDTPVDIARGLARSHLKVGEIDLSHGGAFGSLNLQAPYNSRAEL